MTAPKESEDTSAQEVSLEKGRSRESAASSSGNKPRLIALDLLRGWVVILMTIDHVSLFLYAERWTEPVLGAGAGNRSVSASQFFTRWVSHLCAPTFLFLAGTVLALSVLRRQKRGDSQGAIDRHLIARGAFIALLDPILLSLGSGQLWLQVLWVIGLSLILLVPLRRLPVKVCFALAFAWCLGGEWLSIAWLAPSVRAESVWQGLLLAPYHGERVTVYYPLIGWLSVLLLGWCWGHALAGRIDRSERALRPTTLARSGLLLLAAHFVLRLWSQQAGAASSYGSMGYGWLELAPLGWLHACKQPPSLSFLCLELGLMALCLAATVCLAERRAISRLHPLAVFGRAALFFYVIHWMGLRAVASLTNLDGELSLVQVWLFSLLVLVLLYPACLLFLSLKRRFPDQWFLRYF